MANYLLVNVFKFRSRCPSLATDSGC
uniref:Uncharacterized protein n=1 Tax=Anguilla anguilla TaxID=7936 RepID=A0A0E9URN2_ANGAN